LSLKVEDTFTYKHTAMSSSFTDDTQSATLSVGQPAFGYTGPTDLYVYWDTIFQTFLFTFTPGSVESLLVSGTVTNSSGKPVAGQIVSMTLPGRRFRTITDANGKYRLMGASSKALQAATLNVGSQAIPLRVGDATVKRDVKLGSTTLQPIHVPSIPKGQ
jgi:hypothetical protein